MKYRDKLISIIIIIIAVIPIISYISKFFDHSISDKPSDWGSFGDYVGGIYGFLSTVLLFVISKQFERSEERRSKDINAIEAILSQIGKIKNSKNQIESIGKLQNLIFSNRLLFDDFFFKKLRTLTDHYLEVHQEKIPLNKNLEEEVMKELKKQYSRIK